MRITEHSINRDVIIIINISYDFDLSKFKYSLQYFPVFFVSLQSQTLSLTHFPELHGISHTGI